MRVVLVNPLIPQNTGSIARTCAATGSPLHLIEPLGFEITEKRVRRAGLDYWPHVQLTIHRSWKEFSNCASEGTLWMFSKYAKLSYTEAKFEESDWLVFGSETKGLGPELLQSVPDEQQLLIPMKCSAVRSLNLSNAVAIALYEGLRQTKAL